MLLVVAMLLSLTGTVTYAADNALTVSAGAVTVDVSTDKTVTIPVTVKNNPGFAVGGFNVEYDTTALTFTSAELVADFTNISTNKKTPGNIGVFVERDKNYTEDGVLLNLKFTVTDSAQNGEYSVKLVQNDMYEFVNWDTETTITNVNFVSGSVTVSGVAAQPQVTSLVLKKTTTDTDLTGAEAEHQQGWHSVFFLCPRRIRGGRGGRHHRHLGKQQRKCGRCGEQGEYLDRQKLLPYHHQGPGHRHHHRPLRAL